MPVDIGLIEDAWINKIETDLKTSLGLKMVSPFEGSFDEQTLSQYIVKAPFIFLQCIDDHEILKANGYKTEKATQIFSLIVGCQNLRDRRDGQKGCYSILSALKNTYDGVTLMVPLPAPPAPAPKLPDEFVQLSWERNTFLMSIKGLLIYHSVFHIPEN